VVWQLAVMLAMAAVFLLSSITFGLVGCAPLSHSLFQQTRLFLRGSVKNKQAGRSHRGWPVAVVTRLAPHESNVAAVVALVTGNLDVLLLRGKKKKTNSVSDKCHSRSSSSSIMSSGNTATAEVAKKKIMI
jgi:hypothetical protein